MDDTNQLRKFYFAMLGEVAIHYGLNKDDLHDMLKVGYRIKSTTLLNYDERYAYVENIHYFIAEIYGFYFDSDIFKFENIKYSLLPDCILFNNLLQSY